MSNEVISFISPSRNNLSYLKWMYDSIRKNLGYRHEILLADDFSSDGTWEWLQEIKEKDHNVKIFKNLSNFFGESQGPPTFPATPLAKATSKTLPVLCKLELLKFM